MRTILRRTSIGTGRCSLHISPRHSRYGAGSHHVSNSPIPLCLQCNRLQCNRLQCLSSQKLGDASMVYSKNEEARRLVSFGARKSATVVQQECFQSNYPVTLFACLAGLVDCITHCIESCYAADIPPPLSISVHGGVNGAPASAPPQPPGHVPHWRGELSVLFMVGWRCGRRRCDRW